eukprot:SM000053S17472  [mRNA]  locus=s53:520772:522674:- [translate_table: standard]
MTPATAAAAPAAAAAPPDAPHWSGSALDGHIRHLLASLADLELAYIASRSELQAAKAALSVEEVKLAHSDKLKEELRRENKLLLQGRDDTLHILTLQYDYQKQNNILTKENATLQSKLSQAVKDIEDVSAALKADHKAKFEELEEKIRSLQDELQNTCADLKDLQERQDMSKSCIEERGDMDTDDELSIARTYRGTAKLMEQQTQFARLNQAEHETSPAANVLQQKLTSLQKATRKYGGDSRLQKGLAGKGATAKHLLDNRK